MNYACVNLNYRAHLRDNTSMATLIQRMLSGDDKAVSEFYFQYSKQILLFLLKKLPQDIAEEMLSDVFLDAIDSLPTLTKEANLKAFLYKIAHNKSVDYYRKKRLKTVLLSQVPYLDILASEIHEPEFQAEKNAVKERIEKTLYSISEKYIKILTLHYEERMPVSQIARILQLSPKGAESLLYRARQSFILAYGRT